MDKSQNRRHSYRMQVYDGSRAEGRLRVGRRSIPCHVLDESYGGFLISVSTMPKISRHELSILHMAGGSHPVRIAWQSREGENLHLGLERLPDSLLQRRDAGVLLRVAVILVGFGLGFIYAELGKNDERVTESRATATAAASTAAADESAEAQ
jgi:hypothetical protein